MSSALDDVQVLIAKESMAPAGRVMSAPGGVIPLTDEERSNVIVIDDLDVTYLLIAESYNNSPAIFSLQRRIKDKLKKELVIRKASPAVITTIYGNYSSDAPTNEDRTPLEERLNKILTAAIVDESSDIHFHGRKNSAKIYFRVNGLLRFHSQLSHEVCQSLAELMYASCDAGSKSTSWTPDKLRDGSFSWAIDDGRKFAFRFSSLPIHPSGGFTVVLRVLNLGASGAALENLGYSERSLSDIEKMTSSSSGLLGLCGATNSGKSTTMQAALKNVYLERGDSILIKTIEEPVEYIIPGACQTAVSRKRKENGDIDNSEFIDAIMGALRQDPDILMVGEIRDKVSAELGKDFVLAGRLLTTTFHTFSFMGAFKRLREIAVPWDVITMQGFWCGLIYQRLIPTLCPHCSIPWEEGRSSKRPLFVQRVEASVKHDQLKGIRLHNKNGCPHCKESGVVGRTVCAETWLPTDEFMTLLAEGKDREAYAVWLRDGGVPAVQHAISKMVAGLLCPSHIESGFNTIPALEADHVLVHN